MPARVVAQRVKTTKTLTAEGFRAATSTLAGTVRAIE